MRFLSLLQNDAHWQHIQTTSKEDLLKQGVKAVSSLYLTELNSVKIEEGNCIQVEGMTVEGIQK